MHFKETFYLSWKTKWPNKVIALEPREIGCVKRSLNAKNI